MEGEAGGSPIPFACLDDLVQGAEIEPTPRQGFVQRLKAERKNAGLPRPPASLESAETMAKEGDVAGLARLRDKRRWGRHGGRIGLDCCSCFVL
jgi:hypothetical protein